MPLAERVALDKDIFLPPTSSLPCAADWNKKAT
jgi:hypothetical protein